MRDGSIRVFYSYFSMTDYIAMSIDPKTMATGFDAHALSGEERPYSLHLTGREYLTSIPRAADEERYVISMSDGSRVDIPDDENLMNIFDDWSYTVKKDDYALRGRRRPRCPQGRGGRDPHFREDPGRPGSHKHRGLYGYGAYDELHFYPATAWAEGADDWRARVAASGTSGTETPAPPSSASPTSDRGGRRAGLPRRPGAPGQD